MDNIEKTLTEIRDLVYLTRDDLETLAKKLRSSSEELQIIQTELQQVFEQIKFDPRKKKQEKKDIEALVNNLRSSIRKFIEE